MDNKMTSKVHMTIQYLVHGDSVACLTVDEFKGEHQFQMVISFNGFCALGRIVETDHKMKGK